MANECNKSIDECRKTIFEGQKDPKFTRDINAKFSPMVQFEISPDQMFLNAIARVINQNRKSVTAVTASYMNTVDSEKKQIENIYFTSNKSKNWDRMNTDAECLLNI